MNWRCRGPLVLSMLIGIFLLVAPGARSARVDCGPLLKAAADDEIPLWMWGVLGLSVLMLGGGGAAWFFLLRGDDDDEEDEEDEEDGDEE